MKGTLLFLYLLFVLAFSGLYAHSVHGHTPKSETAHATLPKKIDFVENLGQWEPEVKFKADIPGGSMFLTQNGFVYTLLDQLELNNNHACALVGKTDVHSGNEGAFKPLIVKGHAYRVSFLGAQAKNSFQTEQKKSYYHNYFIGNDSSKWKGNVPLYGKVIQSEIYPGISSVVYSDKNSVKYDFIVKPGGNANDIKLAFEGLDKITIEKGNLMLYTSIGNITESAPIAYQIINDRKTIVTCNYKLENNVVTFEFPHGYNANYELVIDPEIIFSSLTGSTTTNWGYTATYDAQGSLYAGGVAYEAGFPVTLGAFQTTPGSSGVNLWNITLAKFTPAGDALVYSTYLGGNNEDHPHSIVVDANNNLIVAGKSISTNFPTTANAYSTTNSGGFDIIVTKFNAAGSALLGSTYIGGNGMDGVNIATGPLYNINTLRYNYGDDYRGEVITDNAGNIYIAGNTQSNNFPVTPNAAKSTIGGFQDGIFVKLNPNLSSIIYSTYIGGSTEDAAYVLVLDKNENYVYVSGGTTSTDFHSSVTANGWQSSNSGGVADGYIVRFLNSGAYTLTNATLVGTNNYDQVYGVQVDGFNDVYVVGQTMGAFPVTPGVYSNPGSRQFIAKLNPQLSSVIYSTVFGSGATTKPNISPVAFMVDACQNVFVSGWGGNTNNTSTANLPVTPDALKPTTDGGDVYFFVLSRNGAELVYASFFGANGATADHVDGGTSRFDPKGIIYQAICSCNGLNYPATPGAYVTAQPASAYCNIGVVKIDFQLAPVTVEQGISGGGADVDEAHCVRGCKSAFLNYSIIPDDTATVINYQLSGNATNGFDYQNLSGTLIIPAGQSTSELEIKPLLTGSPSTPNPKHVIVTTLSPCGDALPISVDTIWIYDSLYVSILTPLDTVCPGTQITIQAEADPALNYSWSPEHLLPNAQGLTVSPIVTGSTTFTITATQPGAPATCPPRRASYRVIVEPYPVITIPSKDITMCPNDSLNLVIYAEPSGTNFTYNWAPPEYLRNNYDRINKFFAPVGTYKKVITVSSPVANCTSSDSLTITVVPPFTFNWVAPRDTTIYYGDEVQLDSESEAIAWLWSPITYLSDGASKDPIARPLKPMVYTVMGINEYGCTAYDSVRINLEYRQRVFIPNAFTPNGDGLNDVFKLYGVYFEKLMSFRVYNRYGNLVFEGSSVDDEWDGTHKGSHVDNGVYAYDIQLVGENGQPIYFTGEVTLIR